MDLLSVIYNLTCIQSTSPELLGEFWLTASTTYALSSDCFE